MIIKPNDGFGTAARQKQGRPSAYESDETVLNPSGAKRHGINCQQGRGIASKAGMMADAASKSALWSTRTRFLKCVDKYYGLSRFRPFPTFFFPLPSDFWSHSLSSTMNGLPIIVLAASLSTLALVGASINDACTSLSCTSGQNSLFQNVVGKACPSQTPANMVSITVRVFRHLVKDAYFLIGRMTLYLLAGEPSIRQEFGSRLVGQQRHTSPIP